MNKQILTTFLGAIALVCMCTLTACSDSSGGDGPVLATANKTTLIAAIASATAKNNETVVGTETGNVSQTAKDTFTAAIASAKVVADKADATQAEVDTADTTLAAALVTFNGAIISSVIMVTDYIYSPGAVEFFSPTAVGATRAVPDAWGSGSTGGEVFTDATYNPCISVVAGTGWATEYYAACQAYREMNAGVLAGYTNLVFKVKSGFVSELKISVAPPLPAVAVDQVYTLASGTALQGGWIQMSIPLSAFAAVTGTATEFGIIAEGNGILYLTDIGLAK